MALDKGGRGVSKIDIFCGRHICMVPNVSLGCTKSVLAGTWNVI